MGFSRGPPLVLSARSFRITDGETHGRRSLQSRSVTQMQRTPTGCAWIWACTHSQMLLTLSEPVRLVVITISKQGDGCKDEGEAFSGPPQLHQVGLGLELGLASSRAAFQTWRGSCQNGRGCCPLQQPWNKSGSQCEKTKKGNLCRRRVSVQHSSGRDKRLALQKPQGQFPAPSRLVDTPHQGVIQC